MPWVNQTTWKVDWGIGITFESTEDFAKSMEYLRENDYAFEIPEIPSIASMPYTIALPTPIAQAVAKELKARGIKISSLAKVPKMPRRVN